MARQEAIGPQADAGVRRQGSVNLKLEQNALEDVKQVYIAFLVSQHCIWVLIEPIRFKGKQHGGRNNGRLVCLNKLAQP